MALAAGGRHAGAMERPAPSPSPWPARAAAAALVAAFPPAVYWLVGDASEPGLVDPDYLWEPPDWSAGAVRAVGAVAASVVLTSFLGLVHLHRRARLPPAVLPVTGLLGLAGASVAVGYRVVTAGVGGANIGGGLVLLFGPPFVLGLVVVAGVIAVRAGRGRDRGSSHSSPR